VSVLECLDVHVERLLKEEIAEVLEEIGSVDARLEELRGRGDDDSRIEFIVMSAYKRQLVEDLDQLLGFASYHNMDVIGDLVARPQQAAGVT
jgi:beta-phosphoglucomutase-like phosphatase (HAD superfamily)